jgi:peptidoglycan DL-endopeptidase CwlO
LLLFPAFAYTSASATQIDSMKAKAEQLAQQINANGDKISALGEQLDGANYALEQNQAAINDAQQKMGVAERHTALLEARVKSVAVQLYSGASDNNPMSALNVKSANEFALRMQYSNISAQRDQDAISRLAAARQDLTRRQHELAHQRAIEAQHRDAIASAKTSLESANATQQQLLSQVRGQIAVLVKQEQEREAAAARAAALARLQAARAQFSQSQGSSGGGGGGAVDPALVGGNVPNAPAPSPGAAAAIAYARAQLGKPYQYAASGPNSFDCSGLTMMAWRAGGVSMPHYSGAQYAMFPHISLAQLEPGDLIFRGPGGSEHVAMYIGGGMQIAATHTGDYVRIQPLMGGISGAARPG